MTSNSAFASLRRSGGEAAWFGADGRRINVVLHPMLSIISAEHWRSR
jgi:hypothetical protein